MRLSSRLQKLRPSTRARRRPPKKMADDFYHSSEWRALINQIIRRRGRICQDPSHDPANPRMGIRIFGDHILEIRSGGAKLDPNNVMLRCGACHSRKTASARRDRLQGGGGLKNFEEVPRQPHMASRTTKFFPGRC